MCLKGFPVCYCYCVIFYQVGQCFGILAGWTTLIAMVVSDLIVLKFIVTKYGEVILLDCYIWHVYNHRLLWFLQRPILAHSPISSIGPSLCVAIIYVDMFWLATSMQALFYIYLLKVLIMHVFSLYIFCDLLNKIMLVYGLYKEYLRLFIMYWV